MLSSNVEYLSARLHNYSIVAGGYRDSEWKNGVVGPKILRKFWRTASPCEITDGLIFPFKAGL